jgi:hypothetical protein
MRPRSKFVLVLALSAWIAAAAAWAQDDVGKEARLLAIEGKFREADGLIQRAPPEVQNDPALHLGVADVAVKFAKTKTGEEKRDALFSARQHFAKVIELKPDEAKAATGVVDAAQELAQLDLEARKTDEARAQAKFAIEAAEKSVAAGVATPEFKAALGRMYGFRAGFVKSMKEVDLLVSDSTKGATLLAEASSGLGDQAGKLLSEASSIRLRCANLVHEGIPKDDEKRDDEALAAAIDLATKACALPSAAESDFATHLAALRLAHSWGMKLAVRPFMTPLGPPLEGLKLELPRSGGWNRGKSPDWDLLLERNLGDPKNDGTVQIMLKKWSATETSLGKTWNLLGEIAPRRFEKYKEDQAEVASTVEPVQLGGGKNSLELWHYEVGGKGKSGRISRTAEWIWFADRKKESAWQMKIIDWRPVPDVLDPDIVAFVTSAIGEGLWPPGATAPGGKDDGKDPKDPKKPPKKK